MPFPYINNPSVQPPSFDLRITDHEMVVQSDVQQYIQDKMREAHSKVQLPELPPGYSWSVEVEALTNPQDHDHTFRAVYRARKDYEYEEASGQGDLEERGNKPGLAGRVPDSRGLERCVRSAGDRDSISAAGDPDSSGDADTSGSTR